MLLLSSQEVVLKELETRILFTYDKPLIAHNSLAQKSNLFAIVVSTL